MECVLQQAYAADACLGGPLHDVLHQQASHTRVLSLRIDGDGTHTGDRPAVVEEVAANHVPVSLCDDGIDARMGQQHLEKTSCHLA